MTSLRTRIARQLDELADAFGIAALVLFGAVALAALVAQFATEALGAELTDIMHAAGAAAALSAVAWFTALALSAIALPRPARATVPQTQTGPRRDTHHDDRAASAGGPA